MVTVTIERKACAHGYAVADVDIGQSACPPEATARQRAACTRVKRSYWRSESGAWQLITYTDPGRSCHRDVAGRVPAELCDRLA